MRRGRAVASVAIGLAVGSGLVACGDSGARDGNVVGPSETPDATSDTLLVPLGKPVAADIGTATLHLTVHDVRVLGSCPSRGLPTQAPTHGYFVALDVTARLEPAAGEAGDSYAGLGAERFRLLDPDGRAQEISSTEASWSCFEEAELLPAFVDGAETVSGFVVLDSASEHGSILFEPGTPPAWEWSF